MPQQLLMLIIEIVINKALTLNINNNNALHELAEKSLTIELTELNFPLSLTVDNERILVTGIAEHSDCQLTTNFSALQELQQSQQLTELIKQDKLDIRGDLKVAQRFAALFENIRIDWRSELAKHLGDIPTYKLEQFSLWFKQKFQFATQQIQADASEYLVHEQQLAVTSGSLDDFSSQVTELAQRINQLELRMIYLDDMLSTSVPKINEENLSGE